MTTALSVCVAGVALFVFNGVASGSNISGVMSASVRKRGVARNVSNQPAVISNGGNRQRGLLSMAILHVAYWR